MSDRSLKRLLPMIGIAMIAGATSAQTLAPAEVFTRLKSLVGDWAGKTDAGRELRVSYKLVARETVLVETWTLAPGRESLTIYYMDEQNLMADHYCPQGNQPRLRLQSPSAPERFVFNFVSATNFPDTTAAHQHEFDIQILDERSFSRSETYLEKGESTEERVTYFRQK